MIQIILLPLFSLFCFKLSAQQIFPGQDTLFIGPEKYKKEIIQIVQKYSTLLDSIRNEKFARMSKDSLYAQNEMKNRPKKYRKYDGGYEGFLMAEENRKIESIINRFLKIDRVSSSTTQSSGANQVIYTFYYYGTEKTADGGSRSIHGKVIWQ